VHRCSYKAATDGMSQMTKHYYLTVKLHLTLALHCVSYCIMPVGLQGFLCGTCWWQGCDSNEQHCQVGGSTFLMPCLLCCMDEQSSTDEMCTIALLACISRSGL
jgi:hypothetical protein